MNFNISTDTSILPDLDKLLRSTYGTDKNFEYFLTDVHKAFTFCVNNDNIDFRSVAGFEGDQLKAHAALIVDKRLAKEEAFFGFFEVPNDAVTFRSLWDALIQEARRMGISVIKGPVNGSTWYQYRCIKKTDGSPLFKTEVISQQYYYDLLISQKPSAEVDYFSASREPYDIVLKMINSSSYEKLESYGFSMKVIKQVTTVELKTLADISKIVFKDNWGYTELNDAEFASLYSTEKLDAHLDSLYLLYKGKDIIGFCTTFKEDRSTLVLKTICVLPEYRGLGLGNALAYKIHVDAKRDGITKIIYALIRDGNSISNFPKEGAVIFRRYAAFEFNL